MLCSIYKEHTQNSVSLNMVETNNKRQFLCSENQTSFMPAFCPKLVLSLPLWISSKSMLLVLPWLALAFFFLTAFFVRFISHSHLCTFAIELSQNTPPTFAECPRESFLTGTIQLFLKTSLPHQSLIHVAVSSVSFFAKQKST